MVTCTYNIKFLAKGYIKQLLNEVEYNIANYQDRGLCYRPKAEVDNTDRGLDNSRYHTKTEFNNCFIIYSKARKKARTNTSG